MRAYLCVKKIPSKYQHNLGDKDSKIRHKGWSSAISFQFSKPISYKFNLKNAQMRVIFSASPTHFCIARQFFNLLTNCNGPE